MINTFQKSKTSDRNWARDYQEVSPKKFSNIALTHSLCSNCADYYDQPPCQQLATPLGQTNLTTNGGCFPSLISPDRN